MLKINTKEEEFEQLSYKGKHHNSKSYIYIYIYICICVEGVINKTESIVLV